MASFHQPPIREEQPSPSMIRRREEVPPTVTTETTIVGPSKPPQFLKSIVDLTAFAAAVDAFKRRYDELQSHVDRIETAIDSELKSNGLIKIEIETAAASPSQLSPPRSNDSAAIVCQSPPKEVAVRSEAERLCESMSSKELRRYILANISSRAKLIEEIPPALKLAKDTAKFVLDCIGKFYLQGRKAFANGSPAVAARNVSLLVLECYLLTFDPGEEKKLLVKVAAGDGGGSVVVREEAEGAAVAWRRRLMGEGGLGAAEGADARGLLLLVACFGVPEGFKSMDLLDLVRRSGVDGIGGALKRSPFLVHIMSGNLFFVTLQKVVSFGVE